MTWLSVLRHAGPSPDSRLLPLGLEIILAIVKFTVGSDSVHGATDLGEPLLARELFQKLS